MDKEKFIIIDGNALLHRSFHALPPLTNQKGELVNAIYGFMMVLLKALREMNPKYIVVTFDKAEPTFRHKMYKEYKATRVRAEGIEELYNQMPKLKEVLSAFHIPIYEKSGFEADDIIGTIAHKLTIGNNIQGNVKIQTIIVTGDLDTLQLIDDNTKVWTLKKGLSEMIIYGAEQVKERFKGLSPEQMIDYKALRGDPSDNIIGVKGIGEKGAINLLNEFNNIENLYKKLEAEETELSPKLSKLLIDNKKSAFLSKELATIDRNTPIKFIFADCVWDGYDQEKVFNLFQELQFKSLLNKLPKNNNDEKEDINIQGALLDISKKNTEKYIFVDTEDKFEKFLKQLSGQKQIVIDTETTSTDAMEAELLGISFCWKKGEARYIAISSFLDVKNTSSTLPKCQKSVIPHLMRDPEVDLNTRFRVKRGMTKRNGNYILGQSERNKLKAILENSEIKKCGHNIKYDSKVLANHGINLRGINFDTMIASYLLNPGSRAHSLNNLAFTELGHQMIPIEELIGKGKNQISMADVESKKVSYYSCEDGDYTFQLMEKLKSRLQQYKSDKIFNEIEIPLIQVLIEMEFNGVKINVDFLQSLNKELDKKLQNIKNKIFDLAGNEFNISSPAQLKDVLFDKLKIPVKNIKKGKTGLSTAASELEKLRGQHPIIDFISEYRELSKLISTYVNALPKLVNKKTNRVHTSFNQTITATGRLSSSNPNLQNIPIRTELGKSVRKAFIAEKGYKLLSSDYSQIELRIIALLSKDKKMIKAFNENQDIHIATASEIFKVNLEEVTSVMRRQAKAINFGIMYGMGPRGLADTAEISFQDAQNFIDEYFLLYKDVKKYLDKTLEDARKNGYTETFFGRRRYLPEIASRMPMIRASAERMAINHPIQGTSADLIKMAMIELHKRIQNQNIKMILQIHDELLFEVKESELENAKKIIREVMENIVKFDAPIKVDIGVGDNWGEL
ncbi:DNA polymerase I [Patescibacteria group bacterium]